MTGIGLGESHFLGDAAVEFLDLRMIAVEQREKAGLRAGRPLRTAKLEPGQPVFDLFQIEHQVVAPQRGPLADGRRLGRLQVREAEAGQVAILFGEACQRVDRRDQSGRGRVARLSRIRIRSVLSVT